MYALSDILTPGRTVCRAQGISKKRLLETIAGVVSDDEPDLDHEDVLDQLITRERLGSTALGDGIAIPHCRVESCSRPVAALLTLAEPIPFDAPDDRPVDLLFVLLVPAEADQQHLDILAEIARLLSQPQYCKALRAATSDAELFRSASDPAEQAAAR